MKDAAVDTISVWQEEHMRFSRLLDFLEQQMTVSRAGGRPHYALIRNVVHYLHHFADRIHHPREDAAFARLARRDPGLQPYISHLLHEHRAIAGTGGTLLEHLEDIREDDMIKRVLVETVAGLYLGHYRHHLATEENKILPRAAQVLLPEDWAAIATAVSDIPDPLFGDDAGARYQELYEQITREA